MKLFKRFGVALLTVLALTAVLTGSALAAEPAQGDGIAVQLDGKNLTFTDAAPEITSDRTFLPFRAVLEAMGAQVDYDAETSTVSAQKDGVKIAMVPGQTTLTITEGSQTRTEKMDAAPYIKASNGRTYIPVRYAAEAFGYSVGWDQDDRTVILVDVEALFGDATFTLLDRLAQYSKKQSAIENMAISGNLNVDMTDSSGTVLTGPLNMKGSLEGVVSEKGVQLTGKVDGAAIAIFMASTLGGPADAEAFQALPEVSAELRADLNSKMLYASLPGILTGGAEDSWYSLDLSAFETALLGLIDMDQLARLEDADVGEVLVEVMKSLPLDDKDVSYATLAQLAKLYVDVYSDQVFTQKGNTYVAKTTLEDLIDLEITFLQEGDDIVAADIKMSFDVIDSGSKLVMTMDMHAASDKVDMVLELSVDGGGITMDLHLDLNCVPTSEAPVTALPAGVQATPIA